MKSYNLRSFLYSYTPVILLFTSILNEIDFNNLGLKYFSFNFSYILIFYYGLKRSFSIGYIAIFIAGLINDVVVGIPMGISSFTYLLLSAASVYLRNITLRPSILKDWTFFLITILVLNFFTFSFLNIIFNYEIDFFNQIINILCTFLLYPFFSYIFSFYESYILR